MRVKKLKLRAFIEQQVKDGSDLSPSTILEEYNKRTNRNISFAAVSDMLKKMNLNKGQRQVIVETARKEEGQDILDYPEVKSYIQNSNLGSVTEFQKNTQLNQLRHLWELMGKTNPHNWTMEKMLEAVAAEKKKNGEPKNPWTVDDRGRPRFTHPAAVKALFSPFSTMFNNMGTLPKNWSANLCVHKAGELKDFLNFPEFAEFLSQIADTENMSREGWTALFCCMVNMGSREGAKGETGILGLLWEDINFAAKRCSLREKGHRGNARERWDNVPMDMYSWLHGWEALMRFWEQQGKPVSGKVFPVTYLQLSNMFKDTRHKCSSRIKNDEAAMRLHTCGRRTHVQYAQRLGIPLERICGKAPNGRFGVGWKDPKIPVNYYLSEEAEEIDPTELAFMQANPEYAKVLASMQEQNRKIKELLGAF